MIIALASLAGIAASDVFLDAIETEEKGANGTWNRNTAALHEEMSQFPYKMPNEDLSLKTKSKACNH